MITKTKVACLVAAVIGLTLVLVGIRSSNAIAKASARDVPRPLWPWVWI